MYTPFLLRLPLEQIFFHRLNVFHFSPLSHWKSYFYHSFFFEMSFSLISRSSFWDNVPPHHMPTSTRKRAGSTRLKTNDACRLQQWKTSKRSAPLKTNMTMKNTHLKMYLPFKRTWFSTVMLNFWGCILEKVFSFPRGSCLWFVWIYSI